jgi:RNA polymerase sigma factor (sigma-70 family)
MADNQTNGLSFERVWVDVEKTAHLMIRRFRIYGYEYEDLLQEARIECWKALEDFDPNQNVKFNTYFFVRLKNRFRKLYQDANRKKDYYNQHRNSKLNDDLILKFIESNTKNPYEKVIEEENLKQLNEMISLFPKKIIRILQLKVEGFNSLQIGKKVTLSKVTVNKILKKARELLEEGDPDKIIAYGEKYKKGQKSYKKRIENIYKNS